MTGLRFACDESDAADIESHFKLCDGDYYQPLSTRVCVHDYAAKLARRAVRFEAWDKKCLAGLVAMYCNAPHGGTAFITNVSVLPVFRGRGVALYLLDQAARHVATLGLGRITLDVGCAATAAIALYKKAGFSVATDDGETVQLEKLIGGEPSE